jgi:hypothetical protein
MLNRSQYLRRTVMIAPTQDQPALLPGQQQGQPGDFDRH